MAVRSGERAGYSMVVALRPIHVSGNLHLGELVHRKGGGEMLQLAENKSRHHRLTSPKFVERSKTPEVS